MYFLAPGRNRSEVAVKEVGDGVYEARMQLAQPGAYYVYVGVPSMALAYGKLPFFTLTADPPGTAKTASARKG